MLDYPAAREVVSRSPTKTVRILNLNGILDSPVECESTLERDFVYRAVLCPGLLRLRHQPFTLKLSTGRTYTPDFLVKHRDGRLTVVEVKPRQKVPKYREVFDEATARLGTDGIAFLVLDEEAIRAAKREKSAVLILRYRKTRPDIEGQDRVIGELRRGDGSMAIGKLARRAGVSREVILRLLATRTLITSRDLATSEEARVRLFNEAEISHAFRIESWFGVSAWGKTARGDTHPERHGDPDRRRAYTQAAGVEAI
jgi:hypothetical protein